MDELRGRVELKFDVVDEAEHPTRVFRVQIIGTLGDDLRARRGAHRRDERGPGGLRVVADREWRDVVSGVRGTVGLAGDAIRRRLAGREPPVAHAEIAGPLAGTRRQERQRRESGESRHSPRVHGVASPIDFG